MTMARVPNIVTAAALTFVAFGLSAGCATNQGKGALIGTGGGAAVGAGIGALAGGGKGALIGGAIGAGVGAASGAAIGHYMDKQQAALKKIKNAKVERQGDKLVVRFNSAILFDTGKAQLKPTSQKDLAEFARVLKEYPETDLIIEGHTDNTGKTQVNQKLSQNRAESVIGYLSGQGVSSGRMTGRGYADQQPVGDNRTAAGRSKNRRVEVQIKPNQKLQNSA
ncbi:MAG TPA: OmpA family protein [Polyangia bacterium]|nr:OmpA family protein [Polyangia bacterium]